MGGWRGVLLGRVGREKVDKEKSKIEASYMRDVSSELGLVGEG